MPPVLDHESYLRKTFDVARRALSHGNHPFGAILVDPDGKILLECENGFMPDRDMTAHAERLLATMACRTYGPSNSNGWNLMLTTRIETSPALTRCRNCSAQYGGIVP